MSNARRPSPLAQGVVYSPADSLTKLTSERNTILAAMIGGGGAS